MLSDSEKKLLLFAKVILELRSYLKGSLVPTDSVDECQHIAAHLAYAFHNEAEALLDGRDFDLSKALEKVVHLDTRFGDDILDRFQEALGPFERFSRS